MSIKVAIVLELLVSLREHLERLRPFQAESLPDLTKDWVKWYALLHALQILVEHVTDIGNYLLAGTGQKVPDDARIAIRQLGVSDIIPYDFAERIAPMTGFRNILVHEYLTVDPAIVYRVLQHGLDDIQQFAVYIEDYLRREGHLPPAEPAA